MADGPIFLPKGSRAVAALSSQSWAEKSAGRILTLLIQSIISRGTFSPSVLLPGRALSTATIAPLCLRIGTLSHLHILLCYMYTFPHQQCRRYARTIQGSFSEWPKTSSVMIRIFNMPTMCGINSGNEKFSNPNARSSWINCCRINLKKHNFVIVSP